MSSITLNISYKGSTKKITTTKSTTISQLTLNVLSNFKISKDDYIGILNYNQKSLDSSLPIRLTPLINNCKLTLTLKKLDINNQINIRLMHPELGNQIKSCSIGINLFEVLQLFQIQNLENSQLRILNSYFTNDQYDLTRLGDVIGDSPSVVIRFEIIKLANEKEKILKQQQELNRLQLEEQKERLRKQREQEEEAQQQQQIEKEQEQARIKHQDQMDIDQEEKYQRDLPIEMDKPVVESNEVDTGLVDQVNQEEYAYTEPELQRQPQLYMPNSNTNHSSQTYENPDEDYQMTISQAKTYHNIIKNTITGKNKSKSPIDGPNKTPKKYLIRIKFPDNSILQINYLEDVSNIKFGQLIKSIDELILPQYIDLYDLKLGYPPFTKLTQTFNANNEFLYNMPDFQSNETITLIWQLIKNDLNINKGPFVKQQNVIIKTSEDLPERVLERKRGELPDDEPKIKKSQTSSTKSIGSSTTSSSSTGFSNSKSILPKWFKLNKKSS